MRGKLVLFMTLSIVTSVVTAATPARGSAPPGAASVDARVLAPGRLVERVEIGRLGEAGPVVVETRRFRGRSAARPAVYDVSAAAASLATASTESCWYARPVWRRYNGFGKLASKAWYYMEWCGRDGIVTRVMRFFCGGVGAQGFTFDRCRIRRGSTGSSKVNVTGWWWFPFRIGPYTILARTVTVDAVHRGTGRAGGTWWMHQ